ncbi:oxygen regulatory protein NreC [Adhaeribacter aerolatus]|uniref:Oxygen regulatory protein NreC n=1 Tax=Adhaeribacter aerolatus TaxID=670289 RepID=A0A512AY43_9BACT|nr:response regulator transcription factor [Adhaeribacter aerolatus]GEO04629.1 oxygen regulatory protein NreC [Adhaeribacter aerolatus]
MIKVIIVDDHRLIRTGLQSLLKDEPSISIVGEAENGVQLINLLETTPVDVVLMDIKMPEMDGFETAQHILQNFTSVKVLTLTMFENEDYINKMMEMGVQGYILKNISKEELVHAVQTIAKGQNYISAEITLNLLRKNKPSLTENTANYEPAELIELSKRELEVLKLITEGFTNAEIADKLFTSKRTIDSHRQRIIEKTQARNTAALVRYAINRGIIR